jgi:hypothetical protein
MEKLITLKPDPRVAEVLTRNPYPLPDAIAELVDNSLDASATTVLIRFLRNAQKVLSIQVIDNGLGIKTEEFDNAMQFGYRNPHKLEDIGMYGVGLKTSSLSQADELRVFSKTHDGSPAGRQWLRKNLDVSKLNYLSPSLAEKAFASVELSGAIVSLRSQGTIVEWGKVHDFERSLNAVEPYLKKEMRDIENHLGLIFHRLIASKKIEIFLDVVQDGEIVGSAISVREINPFAYVKSGERGYPKNFGLQITGVDSRIAAVAHIWPPRTKQREYKIPRVGGRTNTIDSQGLYIYYHDRLVMPGGWANVRTPEAHFSLARMEIDLTPEAMKVLVIGYSKNNVRIPSSFIEALRTAKSDDGTSYSDWVDLAQEIFRTPDSNVVNLPPLPQPKSGLPASIKSAFRKTDSPLGNEVDIAWTNLEINQIFEVDRTNNRLLLNKKLKKEIINGGISVSDAAAFKTMLLLMLRGHFGSRAGAKLKAVEDEYQVLLMALLGRKQ